jgi:hypothetical protein
MVFMFQKRGKFLKCLKHACLNYLTKIKQFEDDVIQNKSLNKDLWVFTRHYTCKMPFDYY